MVSSRERFRTLSAASLLHLFRSWETELTPAENEALLDEMARRGMTGEEVLEAPQALPCVVGG
jgi:hypothetical protein